MIPAFRTSGCARATVSGTRKLTSGSLDDRLNEWFDTSAFTRTSDYGYGNDSRTEPNLRADGVKNIDFAIFKNTKFGPDGDSASSSGASSSICSTLHNSVRPT